MIMIKIIIKTLSVTILLLIIIIFYLSFFGIKTDKFNDSITNKILEINKNINLKIENVNFLLNPYNFTVNIMTVNPKIYFEDNQLEIKSIKTNISLKTLLDRQFFIDDIQILTNEIKINDAISLVKYFDNPVELFLLDRFTEGGSLMADIKLNFDNSGKIKQDYQINGFIKKGKFNFLNQIRIKNLNFDFNISNDRYTLTKIKTELNNIELSSQLIQINKKKDLFFVKGNIATIEKNFDVEQLSILLGSFLTNLDMKIIRFSSANNFSFNMSKKLKFNNLNIESQVILNQLDIKKDLSILKSYLPAFSEKIKLKNHKIKIKYAKKKLSINGNGKVLIDDNADSIKYQILKDNDKFFFDTKINLKNKKLLVNFLDLEKEKGSDSSISIKGYFEKNNKIKFDSIFFKEKNNKILFKNLNLNKNFKILSIDIIDADYLNNRGHRNQLILKRNKSNYTIEGETFDATKLINIIMNGEDSSSPIIDNFNSTIELKINKTYIDEINHIDNISGVLSFKNNEIIDAKLDSIFFNQKKINLSILINDKEEKITRLVTDYPKPLIKRYKFIKGFEGGYLNYYSVKKNEISNSLLVIDNFKIKKVPVFAKLLSLASLQGVADLLTGEGIRFSNFEMKFSNQKKLTIIEELYAIGPAVSILMDGYIDSKDLVSLRGTLVPATTINRSISSIPVLGKILVGKKTGEGVFGVSFKIKGPPKNLNTTVNPIKTLTPRFITRTLEKIKEN
tara:strand:- start:528 stop:2732 length:2205 start_codon:yes stop_codon:yes gene_type:complete